MARSFLLSYESIPLSLLISAGAEGAEVIYALRNNDTLSKNILNKLSEKGQIVRKNYQRRLPSDTRKDYYYMLRNTPNAESVIVEYGFLDNINDAKRLKSNYKDYADAVIEAVLDYKNIPYNNIDEGYYIVKKGDSLWSIAKNNNTTVNELKELNNLTSNTLSIGQKLKLIKDIDEDIDIPTNTYIIKSGDTLYKIANLYNTTVDELKELNNLTSNTLSIGQILLIPGNNTILPNTYTVIKGDTLYSIANKYGLTVNELKELNNLTNNTLSIGQELLIKEINDNNNTYTVKSGDTLYKIANENNTTVDKLKDINNLTSNTLSIGQTLKLRQDILDLIFNDDFDYYTVKEGDTLYNIADKYNTTVDYLKELNNLSKDTLSIGTLIKIPKTSEVIYIVKKGDTLWSIAKEYNTTVDKLKDINNLIDNTLTVGQQIILD